MVVHKLCLWRYVASGAQALVIFIICEKADMFNESPPPSPRHTMGMLPAEKGGGKMCGFLSFLAEKNLSPLPCGSWGEK